MARNWNHEHGNVIVSDGTERCDARFRADATDERIIREYLDSYGYTEPEVDGRWMEGTLIRCSTVADLPSTPTSRVPADAHRLTFYWRLTSATPVRGRYPYEMRTACPFGQTRVDGYRY